MDHAELRREIDDMASNFLFLEKREIDIPTAGQFLNQLEAVMGHAESLGVPEARRLAGGLSQLLEKVVLESVDAAAGFGLFERGIVLLQSVADGYCNAGRYDGSIEGFMAELAAGLGMPPEAAAAETAAPASAETAPESPPAAGKDRVQDEALLRDFITEGLEYIGEIEVNILNLEQEPENKDYINAIFRPFHSIKGVASFLNLVDIRTLAHDLETLLDKARNEALPVTPELIDLILDGSDTLKAMIGQLRDALEGREATEVIDTSDLVRRIKLAEQGADQPKQPKKLGAILVEEGVINEEELQAALERSQIPPPRKLGQTLIAEGIASPKDVSRALRKQAQQVTDSNTIRVDIKKLDDLIDMVGELVITQSMIRQSETLLTLGDRKLVRDISQLASITSELQRSSTVLRMVPIKQTFQRMARLVRDLSKNSGKLINVVTVGEDTEIDRNMVDEIYNPLVHMIRNAVDHGMEMPEDRIRAGKPERGTIKLKAFHRGGNIVIEISDDGRGLNREKIREKALKNGLIGPSDALTDQEIHRLILLPGFSTAEKITDISGRGVGMDVVKQAVEKLRGKMDIQSAEGKGTTFVTAFPLTMAIIDGMIVKVGSERYILPTVAIRQLIRPDRAAYNCIVGEAETINVMGRLLPLVRLHRLFDIEPVHRNPWEATLVVMEGEKRAKCLLVDEILGKEEVVIKNLGESLKRIKGVSGGAILGDGNVGLILDPEGLFEMAEAN
ncbi:MAG: chemotaxis protein CheA [Syntrophaceae bacterium]|nr:chemotaxis protein CheA [Syntrophaceae bacterium]